MEPQPEYVSFLVRLWRDSDAERKSLAQVEHIPSGEQLYFASLADMFTYIRLAVMRDWHR